MQRLSAMQCVCPHKWMNLRWWLHSPCCSRTYESMHSWNLRIHKNLSWKQESSRVEPPFHILWSWVEHVLVIRRNQDLLVLLYHPSPCDTLPGVTVFLMAIRCQQGVGEMVQQLRPRGMAALGFRLASFPLNKTLFCCCF